MVAVPADSVANSALPHPPSLAQPASYRDPIVRCLMSHRGGANGRTCTLFVRTPLARCQIRSELVTQQEVGPVQTGFHGGNAELQHATNLTMTPLFQISEDNHHAVIRG